MQHLEHFPVPSCLVIVESCKTSCLKGEGTTVQSFYFKALSSTKKWRYNNPTGPTINGLVVTVPCRTLFTYGYIGILDSFLFSLCLDLATPSPTQMFLFCFVFRCDIPTLWNPFSTANKLLIFYSPLNACRKSHLDID